ncbi:hypothetical protein BDF14DRAFT_1743897 [Spinellus fusiger]|nr:hypothetical protein BDF14DRAFT_1743897 [Spinellus fusiger]
MNQQYSWLASTILAVLPKTPIIYRNQWRLPMLPPVQNRTLMYCPSRGSFLSPHRPRSTPHPPFLISPLRPSLRSLSLWKVSLFLLKSTRWQRRLALTTTLGGITLLSSVAGPIVWVAAGGMASMVVWRLWRQTSGWLHSLAPPVAHGLNGLSNSIKAYASSHHAVEEVQHKAMEAITAWTHTNQGQSLLSKGFSTDVHSTLDVLTCLPPHNYSFYSQPTDPSPQTAAAIQHVHTEFRIEKKTVPEKRRNMHGGSGCIASVKATVNAKGTAELKEIRLSAPGWTHDTMVPCGSGY